MTLSRRFSTLLTHVLPLIALVTFSVSAAAGFCATREDGTATFSQDFRRRSPITPTWR